MVCSGFNDYMPELRHLFAFINIYSLFVSHRQPLDAVILNQADTCCDWHIDRISLNAEQQSTTQFY